MPIYFLIAINIYIGRMNASSASLTHSSSGDPGCINPESIAPRTQYPKLNTSYFSDLVTHPKKHLENDFGCMKLSGFDIYECPCMASGAHNRFSRGNTRTKMENLIIEHNISKRPPGNSVKILSLGSGGCLQDLMIIARLVIKKGIKSIDIVLVEPNNSTISSYEELVYLLEEMKKIHNVEINYKRFPSVNNINTKEAFDMVYAIDYEDYCSYLDYSDRKLPYRTGSFDKSPYIATIDLIKAASLAASSEDSLVIMSRGWDIISLAPKAAKSCLSEHPSLSQLSIDLDSINEIYINADIGNLILNLEYLINAKKLLLINKVIVQERDIASVEKFLSLHQISYEFVDDATIPERFKEKKGLVVDCTVFDRNKRETPIPPIYSESNVLVVRIDYTKSRPGKIHMDVYPLKTSNLILKYPYLFGSGAAVLVIAAIIMFRVRV